MSNKKESPPSLDDIETDKVALNLYNTMKTAMDVPFFKEISPRVLQMIFAKFQSMISSNLIFELGIPKHQWDDWIELEVSLYSELSRESFRMRVNEQILSNEE